jgi:prlF antitoxin for toxin YhaV_toxin
MYQETFMASTVEKYSGKVTPVGNSKGIRLDAAFFKAHPEFEGEVRATVLADGQVLLSARSTGRKTRSSEMDDPVLLGFLAFLEAQMAAQPERITAADPVQLARIGKLVKGVKAD